MRVMKLLVRSALAAVLALGGAASGAAVPGQDAPELRAGVADWLAGAEDRAIPALAELARDGNAAARILVALIDKTPELQGPWLTRLPPRDRAALLRAPGGLSGTSWMRTADAPLATLWVRLWSVEAGPELVLDFARAGESRAARETVIALSARQRPGLEEATADPAFPAALRPLVAGVMAETLAPGDPLRILSARPPAPEVLADWLLSAPEGRPVAALCRVVCPQTAGQCAVALHTALGDVLALYGFGSPSESLIPEETFLASEMGRQALLRKALLSATARTRIGQMQQLEATDRCIADRLRAEEKRY